MEEKLHQSLVHKRERLYFIMALIVSVFLYLALAVSLIGIIFIIFIVLISFLFHAINLAQIRRNAVKISPHQFPEIYEKAVLLSKEMGLKKVPSMYVMESMGVMNAFATRFFGKNMVVMYSEIFDLIENNQEDEMMFVLAHEFAHLKRRHMSLHLLILPAMWVPFVGEAYLRACEYTCDRYGAFYIKNIEAAQNALTILAIGKKLSYRVNREAYIAQLEEERGLFQWISEKLSTHPHLPKRINSLQHWQNPDMKPLFKEYKRHAIGSITIVYFLIPAILFGSFYAFDRMATLISVFFLEEVFFGEEYEDVEGVTPLMEAASMNELTAMKEEMDQGADLNAVDSENMTALHHAVLYDYYEATNLLLQSGADINIPDSYGDTPLHTAVINANAKIVEFLINQGADTTIENEEGLTPYEYVEEYGKVEEYSKISKILIGNEMKE